MLKIHTLVLKISLITQQFLQERLAHSHTLFVEPRFLGPMGSPGVQAQIWPPSDHRLYMEQTMSKFRPPSYRSSRDPASQRRCDVITPLSFIISIDVLRLELIVDVIAASPRMKPNALTEVCARGCKGILAPVSISHHCHSKKLNLNIYWALLTQLTMGTVLSGSN